MVLCQSPETKGRCTRKHQCISYYQYLLCGLWYLKIQYLSEQSYSHVIYQYYSSYYKRQTGPPRSRDPSEATQPGCHNCKPSKLKSNLLFVRPRKPGVGSFAKAQNFTSAIQNSLVAGESWQWGFNRLPCGWFPHLQVSPTRINTRADSRFLVSTHIRT